jgi:hypothetical protein
LGEVAAGGGQVSAGVIGMGGGSESKVKLAEGAGTAGKGVNDVFAALFRYDADEADAFAARKELESGAAVRAHDAARDEARSAQDLHDRLMQAFKQVMETRSAALLAAVRG